MAAGRTADFAAKLGWSDPAEPRQWQQHVAERTLSPEFMKAICQEPFIGAIPRSSVGISGALISGDWRSASIPGDLRLHGCRIDGDVCLWGSNIGGDLSLSSCWIGGRLWFNNVNFQGSLRLEALLVVGVATIEETTAGRNFSITNNSAERLFMGLKDQLERRTSFPGGLSMSKLTVNGSVHIFDMDAAGWRIAEMQVKGSANLGNLSIADSIHCDHARFEQGLSIHSLSCMHLMFDDLVVARDLTIFDVRAATLCLHRTRTEGTVDISGTLTAREAEDQLEGFALDLDGLVVGSNLSLSGTLCGRTGSRLERMKVGGNLEVRDGKCEGYFRLTGTVVQGNLSIADSVFEMEVLAQLVQVMGSLTISNTDLADFSLAGAKVGRDLSLGRVLREPPRWSARAQLDLHNAEVGAISEPRFPLQRQHDPWPARLDLRGFVFSKVVAFGGFNEDRSERSSADLQAWLARDKSGSTQPYLQLAKVLRDGGEVEKANDVLYAGRELTRARAREEGMRWRWLGLSLLKWTIGYGLGIRYFRALAWVAAFVAIGVATLHFDQILGNGLPPESTAWTWKVAASLDALLPIVSLDKTFSDNIPSNLTFYSKVVFWLLGIAGWVLGAFLATALGGLTQKQS
jgi:hypothetical protein